MTPPRPAPAPPAAPAPRPRALPPLRPATLRRPPLHALGGVPGLLLAVGARGRVELAAIPSAAAPGPGAGPLPLRPLPAPQLPDLHGVAVAAPDCAFLCGQGGALLRFDGRRLTPIDARTRRDLLCAACAGPDEAWFGGAGVLVHYRRAYRHEPRREGPREHVTTYPVPCGLRAACCAQDPGGAAEAWLLGPGRLALRWHGEALTPRRLVDPAERARGLPGEAGGLLTLAASAPDDLWAGGEGGALLHYDGRALRRIESGTGAAITALCLGPAAEPWVATSTGELRRLVDRAIWSVAAVVAGPAALAQGPARGARAATALGAAGAGRIHDLAYAQALCAVEDRIYLCTGAAVLQLPVTARC